MKSFLLTIAGPPAGGKTLITEAITSLYPQSKSLSIDDYFLPPDKLPTVGKWKNSDTPKAIDFDRCTFDLNQLLGGKEIVVDVLAEPHKSWRRISRKIEPAPLIVFEGFMALYDERIRRITDLSLYIDIGEEDIISRRRKRNPKEDPAFIRELVLPGYRKYVAPTRNFADHIIDGSQPPDMVTQQTQQLIKHYYKKAPK